MGACSIRLDIDTWTGLTKGLDEWLELTDFLDISSTISISLGPYNTGRGNILRIIDPRSPKSPEPQKEPNQSKSLFPWERTHWKDLVRGVITPKKNISKENAKKLIQASKRHEIIPHGYNHTFWSHKFSLLSEEKTTKIIDKMIKSYRKIFSTAPRACSAPALQINPYYWKTLEKNHFVYSSDLWGKKPFFTNMDEEKGSLIQLPISCPFMGTLLARDFSLKSIVKFYLQTIEKQVKRNNYSCWVIHANYEPMRYKDLLSLIIKRLKEKISFIPLKDHTKSTS